MDVSRKYIESLGGFSGKLPDTVNLMLKVVPERVPRKLALAIVLSELTTFISSFRNNIQLNTNSTKHKTFVPTNLYMFGLSPSGVSKDRTRGLIKDLMEGGYKVLDSYLEAEVVLKAKAVSVMETGNDTHYGKYKVDARDNDFKFGTSAGIGASISDIGNKQSYGTPFLVSSEIGSDLATRGEELSKTFTLLSDVYDLGNLKFDTVKGEDSKVLPVKNLPVNVLVFGSEQGILLDSSNKKRFKGMFNQQLARRCLFSFTRYVEPEVQLATIQERHDARDKLKLSSGTMFDTLYDSFTDLADWLPTNGVIYVDLDVDQLKDDYEDYNRMYADTMEDTLPISKLARMHKQWIALKLSGVYALLDSSINITISHYIDALNTVEYLADDLIEFEKELDKEPYEQLLDYCKENAEDGQYTIGVTEMKKLGFIEGRSGAKAKMNELILYINDATDNCILTVEDSSIHYQETVMSDTVGVSVIDIDVTAIQEAVKTNASKEVLSKLKQQLTYDAVYGYTYMQEFEEGVPITFKDFNILLEGSYAYTPFKLKDASVATYNKDKHTDATGGVRGKDNIDSGAKFVVLDIDTSSITDEEAHLMLEGINHHVARTSNPDNPFKFRVIVEMDMEVNVTSMVWGKFITKVGEHLGLNIDKVPQSQIFYSYNSTNVLSEIHGEPLKVKDFILSATSEIQEKLDKPALTKAQIKTQTANPRNTFSYAYEHPTYTGLSSKLMRCVYHAQDLGCSKEFILNLVEDVNNYVQSNIGESLEPSRLESTILSQIRRM